MRRDGLERDANVGSAGLDRECYSCRIAIVGEMVATWRACSHAAATAPALITTTAAAMTRGSLTVVSYNRPASRRPNPTKRATPAAAPAAVDIVVSRSIVSTSAAGRAPSASRTPASHRCAATDAAATPYTP